MILKKGTSASSDKEQVTSNIVKVCRIIGETFEGMLGPRGLDKLLVDEVGDTFYAADGATVFEALRNNLKHPVIRMVSEAARSLDREVGDNVKTLLILLGRLMRGAEELRAQGLKPSSIINGYAEALDRTMDELRSIRRRANVLEHSFMLRVAENILSRGDLIDSDARLLSELSITAVMKAIEIVNEDSYRLDLNDIQIKNKLGGDIRESFLVSGVVIDKVAPGSINMPKRVENPRIALLLGPLEVKKTSLHYSSEIVPSSPQRLVDIREEINKIYAEAALTAEAAGVNVLLSKKEVHDIALEEMAKRGIMAIYRFDDKDIEFIAKATGAKPVYSYKELNREVTGSGRIAEQRIIGRDKWIVIDGCRNSRACTLILRAPSFKALKKNEKLVVKFLKVTRCLLEEPYIVPGGGATEMYIANRIRSWASSQEGRKQLATLTVASALEWIPFVLASNVGADPHRALTSMRKLQGEGVIGAGVMRDGRISDSFEEGVFEPYIVKEKMLRMLKELVAQLLRVDNVVLSRQIKGNVTI